MEHNPNNNQPSPLVHHKNKGTRPHNKPPNSTIYKKKGHGLMVVLKSIVFQKKINKIQSFFQNPSLVVHHLPCYIVHHLAHFVVYHLLTHIVHLPTKLVIKMQCKLCS